MCIIECFFLYHEIFLKIITTLIKLIDKIIKLKMSPKNQISVNCEIFECHCWAQAFSQAEMAWAVRWELQIHHWISSRAVQVASRCFRLVDTSGDFSYTVLWWLKRCSLDAQWRSYLKKRVFFLFKKILNDSSLYSLNRSVKYDRDLY